MFKNPENLENHMLSNPIYSTYESVDICHECGEDIYEGDEVFCNNEEYYCINCMESYGYYYSSEEFSLSKDTNCNRCNKEFEEDEYMYLIPEDSTYNKISSYCDKCAQNNVTEASPIIYEE